jgi:uncharacterized SAM-binding protein YcdF (DUF218 family)
MYGRARVRSLKVAAVVTLGYVALFWSPLPWIVAKPLHAAAAPRAADAVVVLAAGVGESGKPEGYQERVEQAVRLYHARHARHIVFSTGYVFVFPEAQVMKALAVSLGIPADAILLQEHGGGTDQNVAFVRPMLAERGWKTVLLVSSPYHMRRAMMTFRKMAPEIDVVPVPAPSCGTSSWRASCGRAS